MYIVSKNISKIALATGAFTLGFSGLMVGYFLNDSSNRVAAPVVYNLDSPTATPSVLLAPVSPTFASPTAKANLEALCGCDSTATPSMTAMSTPSATQYHPTLTSVPRTATYTPSKSTATPTATTPTIPPTATLVPPTATYTPTATPDPTAYLTHLCNNFFLLKNGQIRPTLTSSATLVDALTEIITNNKTTFEVYNIGAGFDKAPSLMPENWDDLYFGADGQRNRADVREKLYALVDGNPANGEMGQSPSARVVLSGISQSGELAKGKYTLEIELDTPTIKLADGEQVEQHYRILVPWMSLDDYLSAANAFADLGFGIAYTP